VSPNLSDLEDTDFNAGLFNFFGSASPVTVFYLHSKPSGYIQSLKEFQVIRYANGTHKHLKSFMDTQKFPLVTSDTNTVPLLPAGITIRRSPGEGAATDAPDHLLRLFSYNQVLKSIGKNYFNNDYLEDEIIKEAAL